MLDCLSQGAALSAADVSGVELPPSDEVGDLNPRICVLLWPNWLQRREVGLRFDAGKCTVATLSQSLLQIRAARPS